MRPVIWIALAASLAAGEAEADTIALDPAVGVPPAHVDALRIELAARSHALAVGGDASADAAIDVDVGAVTTVWVRRGDVRRGAAMPASIDVVSPRVFAVTAASLVDELLAPRTDVSVTVDVGGSTSSAAPPEPPAVPAVPEPPVVTAAPPSSVGHGVSRAPGVSVAAAPAPSPSPWFAEAGGLTALVASGAHVGIGRYVGARTRAQVTADVVYIIPAEESAWSATFGVTRVRDDWRSGFSWGVHAGYVRVSNGDMPSEGFRAGGFVGWRWPVASESTLEGRLGIDGGAIDGSDFYPVPLASLNLELPL